MKYFVVCVSIPNDLCLMDHNGGVRSISNKYAFDDSAYSVKKYATTHAKDLKKKYSKDKFQVVDEDGLKRIMIMEALR